MNFPAPPDSMGQSPDPRAILPPEADRPGPYFRPHLLVDAPLAGLHLSLAVTGYWAALAGVSAGIIGLHAWASMYPRSPWYVRTVARLPASETACALTFDDGPHPEFTPRVLDLLARHHMRATFFVIGEHAQQHGALLRRIVAEGHSLGLHSWHHARWFSMLSARRIKADLRACGDTIAQATGQPPPRLFRAPVGVRSPNVADAAYALRLTTVAWSKRLWDTQGAPAARVQRHLECAVRPRAIILAHDGHEPKHPGDRSATIAALSAALPTFCCPSRALRVRTDGGITTCSDSVAATTTTSSLPPQVIS